MHAHALYSLVFASHMCDMSRLHHEEPLFCAGFACTQWVVVNACHCVHLSPFRATAKSIEILTLVAERHSTVARKGSVVPGLISEMSLDMGVTVMGTKGSEHKKKDYVVKDAATSAALGEPQKSALRYQSPPERSGDTSTSRTSSVS